MAFINCGGGSEGGSSSYIDFSAVLPAGSTQVTITDADITADGDYEVLTDVFGIDPVDVYIQEGSAIITFDPYGIDLNIKLRKTAPSTIPAECIKTLTATLEAGETELTFTSRSIIETSILFITALNSTLGPESIDTSTSNSVTYTFEEQEDDVVFKLLIINEKSSQEVISGNDDSYSESEIEIGTWIDGSKIYRRVINSTITTLSGNQKIELFDVSEMGIDMLIKVWGVLKSTAATSQCGIVTDNFWIDGSNKLSVRPYSGYSSIAYFKIILEYTKSSNS